MVKTLRKSKKEYSPKELTPFIYAHTVVCVIESETVRSLSEIFI